ncbi:MAG TPA: UDP-N-acetylmuramoyl-L-alanine--D-glutamate ligase [Actinomycetota bacterium]
MTLDVRDRTVVVVGLAASGLAAVRVLRGEGAAVRVTEARPREEVEEEVGAAEAAGAEVLAGGHAPEHLRGADLVVTSPGVPEGAPVLAWALDRGIPVWSEIELGARLSAAPYVGVTGTNGKTTTTEMVAAALRADGRDAVACGNAGHPFSLAATEGRDVLAVEVSSFQLRFHQRFHPKVSVLLNVAPDHLDWHGSLEAYEAAKARIYACQGEGDLHVGNADDPVAAEVSRSAPCPVAWTTLGEPGEHQLGYVGDHLVSRLDAELDLGPVRPASHAHMSDAAAAAAAALGFGAAPDAVSEALRGFRPLAHRGEVVARLGDVVFVDDSKATNPHAALASIAGWDRVALIAGGRAKGVDLAPLTEAAPRLLGVVAIGEAAKEVARAFEGIRPVARADSIEEAVGLAAAMAAPAGTVLLAPACASQDMFRDYGERGGRFAAAARALAERETG